jgi:conserved oligomeric Golgi complex subunit 2
MMGFQRDVEGVRRWVEERSREVARLMEELREVRRKRNLGKGLLEVDRRMGELEERLGLKKTPTIKEDTMMPQPTGEDEWADWDGVDQNFDSEDSDDETEGGVSPRLQRRMEEYLIIRVLSSKLGIEHPFLINQRDRMIKIRASLLLDLESAMKNAQDDEARKQIMRLRISLDEDITRQSKAKT